MQILESRSAFLTNFEVSKHLEDLTRMQDSMLRQKGSYSSALESENLRTIQFELKAYLEEQPCQVITPKSLTELLRELKNGDFGLTKVEKLMILNQVPGNEAEISVLLEEYADRFTEEERTELIALIEQCIGRRPPGPQTDVDMTEQGSQAMSDAMESGES